MPSKWSSLFAVAVGLVALAPIDAASVEAIRAEGLGASASVVAPDVTGLVADPSLRVIVGLRSDIGEVPGTVRIQAIAGAQDRLASRLWALGYSMPGWHAFESVPAVVMEVDASSLASLLVDLGVESVSEDRLAKTELTISVPLVDGPAAWALGYTGQGVAVAILDTGVDRTHPFFGGRVVHEACFSTSYAPDSAISLCPDGTATQNGTDSARPCSLSGCSHGTHVAGIAAGYQSDSFAGIARDAQIIAIQVFSRFDSAAICGGPSSCIFSYTSDQIRALDYVLGLRSTFNISSVNLSLGGQVHTAQASCDLANPTTKRAIDSLRASGIATVIAAGNESYINALSEPGCISSAVSVGNTTNLDVLSPLSNISSFITMVAPGTIINSSVPGGEFGIWSGTSMATAHVSGGLAVLRQAHPNASVGDLVAAMRAGGRLLTLTVGGANQVFVYVVPRLDMDGALAAANAIVTPASGWWWNASEPGRGFSLETRQGRMYLGTFLYENDGSPTWFVVNGAQSDAGYAGLLAKFGFGQTLAGAYRPAQLVATAGIATVSFSSATAGTLTWAGGTVAIQRFPVNGQTVVAPQAGALETGWWWNPSEPGTGWFFEVQGSNLFMAGFLYDDAGRSIWYVSSGAMLNTSAFDGDLQLYAGGQTMTGDYRAPSSTSPLGRLSLRFGTSGAATLTLPQGRTIQLTRFSNF